MIINNDQLCVFTGQWQIQNQGSVTTLSSYILLPFLLLFNHQVVSSSLQPMESSSPPGSLVHGISKAKILEWVAISFSRESSLPKDRTHISCLAGGFFTTEPPVILILSNKSAGLVFNQHNATEKPENLSIYILDQIEETILFKLQFNENYVESHYSSDNKFILYYYFKVISTSL